MSAREFDLVVYGATGFVGRRAVRELAAHAERGRIRLAIAGRDRAKLDRLAVEVGGVPVLVADATDVPAIEALVARTRVVLAMAGPFAVYADAVVAACVRHGTHYADITGETPWVRTLIDRFHDRAAADGTRIVPGCGFDSVPSDLGAYLVARTARRELGTGVRSVRAYYSLMGGANGGTLATFLRITGDPVTAAQLRELDLLTPAGMAHPHQSPDPILPTFDPVAGAWTAPFFMGPINTRVVRRSAALEAQAGTPYGDGFTYQEYLRLPLSAGGPLAASAVAAGTAGFMNALQFEPTRRVIASRLPPPGSGPSDKALERGWFRCTLAGFAQGGKRIRGMIAAKGDPGNVPTATFAVESALALALDQDRLPGGPKRGGILTPATALGDVLLERIRGRGVTCEAEAT